jgi:hypothetical protein
VAEGVVELLEVIEVEQEEGHRLVRARGDLLLDAVEEQPPVREAGELVGEGLVARLGERAQVPEGQDGPAERHDERRVGEDLGQDADRAQLGEDEHAHRAQHEGGGDEQDPRGLDAILGRGGGSLPGGKGQERGRAHVEEVAEQRGVRRARRDVQEVDAVGQAERHEAGADERPGAVELPAAQGEHADDQGGEEDVGDGVGELGGHLDGAARGGGEDRGEDDGGAERRDPEAAHEAVEPHPGGEPPAAAAGEQHEADVAEGIQRQPEDVAHGGDGWCVEPLQPLRPQDVAQRVEDEPDRDEHPREAVAPHAEGAGGHDRGRQHVDEGRRPVARQGAQGGVARGRDREQRRGEDGRGQGDERGPQEEPLAASEIAVAHVHPVLTHRPRAPDLELPRPGRFPTTACWAPSGT